ncbi:MAG: hypothetical protein WD295_05615, partial [Bacteroidota bacterium]
LRFQKDGHEALDLTVGPSGTVPSVVRLQPSPGLAPTDLSELLSDDLSGGRPPWLTYSAAGTMVVSGVLAAYLKDRGNASFRQYEQTLDGSHLESTRMYDRGSAAVLILSQVSLGILSYLLLTE